MTADTVAHSFIDTHAHLDDEQFEDDVDAVIFQAITAGVERIVNIGYEPVRWDTTIKLAEQFPCISFTLGLHPSSSEQFSPEVIDRLGALAEQTGAVAIGEIGIDLFRESSNLELQRQSFEAQLSIARDLHLPVVIHQRAASKEVSEILSNVMPTIRCVLHSFEGNEQLLRLGIDRSYCFGIGGLMTRRGSESLKNLIKEIPLELMLLETDSPYLIPAGAKGRRNEPANIPKIADTLSKLLDIPLSDVADTTSRNAIEIFRLDSVTPGRGYNVLDRYGRSD
jgi:TatD DNase family protein